MEAVVHLLFTQKDGTQFKVKMTEWFKFNASNHSFAFLLHLFTLYENEGMPLRVSVVQGFQKTFLTKQVVLSLAAREGIQLPAVITGTDNSADPYLFFHISKVDFSCMYCSHITCDDAHSCFKFMESFLRTDIWIRLGKDVFISRLLRSKRNLRNEHKVMFIVDRKYQFFNTINCFNSGRNQTTIPITLNPGLIDWFFERQAKVPSLLEVCFQSMWEGHLRADKTNQILPLDRVNAQMKHFQECFKPLEDYCSTCKPHFYSSLFDMRTEAKERIRKEMEETAKRREQEEIRASRKREREEDEIELEKEEKYRKVDVIVVSDSDEEQN